MDGHVSFLVINERLYVELPNVQIVLTMYIDLAPEMANSLAYNFQVDVWSLGIMSYEMVTGYSPFSGSENEILNKIKTYSCLDNIKNNLELVKASPELYDFLNKILVIDSSKRITIEEVLSHPWIQKNLN